MSDPIPTLPETHEPAEVDRTEEQSYWSKLSAYLEGAATVLDLPGIQDGSYHCGSSIRPQENVDVDVVALGSDWSAVGDDLRAATVQALLDLLARRSTRGPRDAAVRSAAQDLLDEISVRQDRRFSILSGECGAGKSALLNRLLSDQDQEAHDLCLLQDRCRLILVEAKHHALTEAAKNIIRLQFGDYRRRKQEAALENQVPAKQDVEVARNRLPSFRAYLSAVKAAIESRSADDAKSSKPAKSQEPSDKPADSSPRSQKHFVDVRG
jgi:hypothetical protein